MSRLSKHFQLRFLLLLTLSSLFVACSLVNRKDSSQSPQQNPPINGQETHGGDLLASWFVAKGYRVYDHLLTAKDGQKILSHEELVAFLNVLRTTRVQPVDGPIIASDGSQVDARNGQDPLYPNRSLIELHRSHWENIFRKGDDVYRLVFHEYLWLLGINDENYKVSNKLNVLESEAHGFGRWTDMSDEGAPFSDLYNQTTDTGTVMTSTHFMMTQSSATTCEPIAINVYDMIRRVWTPYSLPLMTLGIDRTIIPLRDNRVFVWGGICPVDMGGTVDNGILFNPRDGSWTTISKTNAPVARHGGLPILTPTGVVIYGGSDMIGRRSDGALYNLATDEWSPIPESGLPLGDYHGGYIQRPGSQMADHVIVWEARNKSCKPVAGIWDLKDQVWKSLTSKSKSPSICDWQHAVWTGRHFAFLMLPDESSAASSFTEAGWLWDPVEDIWTRIPMLGAPNVYVGASVVWTGESLVVFGGKNLDGEATNSGSAFHVDQGVWRQLSVSGAPSKRYAHVGYWAGGKMIVWGGRSNIGTNVRTGAIWTPE